MRAYQDDTPYPSRLVLGWFKTRPLSMSSLPKTELSDKRSSLPSMSQIQKNGTRRLQGGARDEMRYL